MESPVMKTTPYWTEEKHVNFLNSMEASFVRRILQKKKNHEQHYCSLCLNRHIPDTSESTLDLKPHNHHRRNRHGGTMKYREPSVGSVIRRTRRRSSQPLNSSEDQVVPQIENQE